MVYCAVVGCSSNNNKKSKNSNSYRFFTFPSSKEICNVWVQKCYQKHKFNIKTARICSQHFSDDDFQLRKKLLKISKNKWKLKTDAIPSLNLPKTPKPKTELQDKRDKRNRKRFLKKNVHNIQDEHELTNGGRENVIESESGSRPLPLTESQTPNIDNNNRNSKATQTESSSEQSELMKQMRVLQNENKHLKELLQIEREETKSVEQIFTKGQLRKLKTKKQIQWSIEDVTSAISLYAGGPRSYRLLKKRGYPLPSVPTLRRWASKINSQSGILNIVLTLMKNTTFTKMERSCVLLFDEMKIQSSYDYDKKNDTTLAPNKYVQVVMARRICGNWKQPIFYDYDCKLTKNLLFKIITKLENIGYPVYAINSDLGGSNRGLWTSLNISEQNTHFENPVSHKRVHVFADAPHMIKLLRNHFLDSGFLLNEKIINSEPIVDLLQNTQNIDLNIAHKLNAEMLTVKGPQRQKVKYATKLFSHTISKAVSRLGILGIYKAEDSWFECSEFLKVTNDWFDVFNSQIPRRDSRNHIKAYGLALEEQNEILEKMKKNMKEMRRIGSTSLLPFQKGIIIGIESLKTLFKDMQEDFNIKYLLTYHLNQDPLEGFLSIMRAIGGLYDHPTSLQFKYRLRNYLMGRNDEINSESANIQQDQSNIVPHISPNEDISAVLSGPNNPDLDHEEPYSQVVTMLSTLNSPDVEVVYEDAIADENMEELRWDGLENLAGFIAFKLRKKEQLGFIPDCNDTSFSWTNHLTEGGLQKPTLEFLTKCNELDQLFNKYNGTSLKIEKNYLKNLSKLAETIDLSGDAKNLFFRCKMYFKIRILNRQIKETSNIRKRKMSKVVK